MNGNRYICLLTVIIFFSSFSISQNQYSKQDEQNVENLFRLAFCKGVENEKSCRIPSNWQDIDGICCSGRCNFYGENCNYWPANFYPFDKFSRQVCLNIRDGRECNIPKSALMVKSDVRGVCCEGFCNWMAYKCENICGDGICSDLERQRGYCHDDCVEWDTMDNPKDEGPDMDQVAVFVCLGIREGASCHIEDEMRERLDLFGVCCNETITDYRGAEEIQLKCKYRKKTCNEENIDKPDLIISSIDTTPKNPAQNQKINLTISIENIGSVRTNSDFYIQLTLLRESRELRHYNKKITQILGPREKINFTFTDVGGTGETGSFRLKAIVDTNDNYPHQDNLIAEENEENNGGSTTIYITNSRYGSSNPIPSDNYENPVCGDGFCHKREEDNCDIDCNRGPPKDEILLIIGLFLVMIIILIIYKTISSRKKPGDMVQKKSELSLGDLEKEKERTQELISIAKKQYHQRQLDEESFREIVRDNQVKIIQLQQQINEIQGKVDDLKKK